MIIREKEAPPPPNPPQDQSELGSVPPASSRQVIHEPVWLVPVVDMILALLAFFLAYATRYELQIIRPVLELNQVPYSTYLPYTIVFTGWLLASYAGGGLYRRYRSRSFFEELSIITNGVTNATVVIMAMSFMLQARGFSRLMLVYLVVISVVLLAGARLARRSFYAYMRLKRGVGVQRVLVVGAGDVGQAVLRVMIARRDLGYLPVGYLDDNPARGNVDLGRLRGLGGIENLHEAIYEHDVDLVVITLPWEFHNQIMSMVKICRQESVDVRVVPDVFQLNLRQVNIENLDGIPLLGVSRVPSLGGANRVLKRAADLMLMLVTAPLWLPIFGLVALAIHLDGDGPVFYTQKRVGENGKLFDMIKFRSMIPDADRYRSELVNAYQQDPRHPKIEDDWRITRIGRLLRRTSMDELPNFINVLRGEMSLVGPRPPTPDEVELYDDWHMQRLKTIPGISGLWQVSGRSDVPFDEMVLLDIYYIENWSLRLDAEILLRTVPRVLLREGAY